MTHLGSKRSSICPARWRGPPTSPIKINHNRHGRDAFHYIHVADVTFSKISTLSREDFKIDTIRSKRKKELTHTQKILTTLKLIFILL